jgi:hypothetical protein
MDRKNKNAIMISDLLTDEHMLITRHDIDLIKSALLSLQRDFYELGEPDIEHQIMGIWHKINDFTKDIKRKERE